MLATTVLLTIAGASFYFSDAGSPSVVYAVVLPMLGILSLTVLVSRRIFRARSAPGSGARTRDRVEPVWDSGVASGWDIGPAGCSGDGDGGSGGCDGGGGDGGGDGGGGGGD